MTTTSPKICIVGAGAIGSHIAGMLAAASIKTSVVARGAQLTAIQKDGITVIAGNDRFNVKLPASGHGRDLGPQDIVICCLKAPSLPAALPAMVPLLGTETAVVFMLNGIPWWYFHAHGGGSDDRRLPPLDPDDVIWRMIGPDRAIGGVVHSASAVTAPGVVTVESPTSRFIVGEPSGTTSPRLEAIAQVLRAGGFGADITPKIRTAIWQKLMLNAATGPLCVLAQNDLAEVFKAESAAEAFHRIIDEITGIAAAWNCDVSADAAASAEIFETRIRLSRHKPSILQDLEAGRTMEIDAIYGVPIALGAEAGVAAPTLGLLTDLVKVRARAAGLYARA